MSVISNAVKRLLNNATPGLFRAKLGDVIAELQGREAPAASDTVAGVVLQGDAVVDATDAPSAITQLNALLASLRASGAIAP